MSFLHTILCQHRLHSRILPRATGQPLWLTPPTEWTSRHALLDRNHLYSFTLPVSVANTPHSRERGMAELDIRDVRLVQAIHGGLSNWLLCPFAHGRFVTWEGFRTRTEALLCSFDWSQFGGKWPGPAGSSLVGEVPRVISSLVGKCPG